MVAFGDFWAINPPKVEVTVTVKVEVKGVLKDEVNRVLRAPEAACVVGQWQGKRLGKPAARHTIQRYGGA